MNAPSEPRRLSDLTPEQRKSGFAAWLGWMFDGLDMHIYTLVASGFVAMLVYGEQFKTDFAKADADSSGAISGAEWNLVAPAAGADRMTAEAFAAADHNHNGAGSRGEVDVFFAKGHTRERAVADRASWIQAAFLVGWALGGAFFGRLGDLLGRSRSLALTVLTYACCPGLCALSQTWWQLMIFRFVAALGIGGEWAVGASLLAETWPRAWRPWMAAVLQTGVNVGVILGATVVAQLTTVLKPGQEHWVFLIGVLPALLVFWIRRHVPEPETWQRAEETVQHRNPGVRELFRGRLAGITGRTTAVCALSLSAWWLFIFWQSQHLRKILGATG